MRELQRALAVRIVSDAMRVAALSLSLSVCFAVSVWPLPVSLTTGAAGSVTVASNAAFAFVATTPEPSNATLARAILEASFVRYRQTIFREDLVYSESQRYDATSGALASLNVQLNSLNDALQLGVDESYTLSIPASLTESNINGTLVCATVYGCLRGLETFSQLIVFNASNGRLFIEATPVKISDAPRFSHRGIMIDTSRHFVPIATLCTVIDGMVVDKLNTLHWHLTDAQSFPISSEAVPALVQGAWAPTAVYSLTDLRGVVEYAKFRGVRIVPEVDTPAHSASWALGRPDLVLRCGSISDGYYSSLLDPTREETYETLAALFAELTDIFTDDAFHIGGDEVDVSASSCYNSSSVVAWMPSVNITAGDFKGVVRYHLARVQSLLVARLGKRLSAWQEVADHYGADATNPTMPPQNLTRDTALHVWLEPQWEWYNMSFVVSLGFRGVKCDDWYLSDVSTTWQHVYAADPLTDAVCTYDDTGTQNCTCTQPPDPIEYGCFNIKDPALIERVIGGEASVWGEQMDATNVMQLLWPRASAVAERLWSAQRVNNATAALPRIVDQRCRLVARGIPASPVMPGWCDGMRR